MAKPGRNDACPCGSGKKYKRCCVEKDEARAREAATPKPPAPPPGVTVSERAAPPPREASPDMARWEAFWERFHVASIDEKLALAHEVAGGPDFDEEYAFELGNALQQALAPAGRWDDLDAFVARIEREHPEAHASNAAFFALLQAQNELEAARGRELTAMRRLGAHFSKTSELGRQVLERLVFHGRADLVEALLATAWPSLKESELFDFAKDEYRAHLVDAIVVRHRARLAGRSAADAALLDELAPLFDDRAEAERAVASWFAPTTRAWSYGDFARVGLEQDTSLRDLLVGFRASLESRAGFHPLRAEMAAWGVFAMIRRAIERRNRDGDVIGCAAPTAARPFPLAPSPDAEGLRGGHYHDRAALLLALPHWGAHLAAIGLVDGAEAERAWREFQSAVRAGPGADLIARLTSRRDRAAAEELRALLAS